MDKEYYTSSEYKKIDEYKKFQAEDYRGALESFSPKINKPSPEDNLNRSKPRAKPNRPSQEDSSSIRKLLDKITTSSSSVVATTTVVATAAVGAVAVVPEIVPELPPIIPELAVTDLSIGIIQIENNTEAFVYTGKEITPAIKLLIGGEELSNELYTVEYENNIMPGLATIRVIPKNDRAKGEVSLSFMILKDENTLSIRYENGELVIDSLYDQGVLRYYSDSECNKPIDKPTEPGSYFVRAEAAEGEGYKAAVSNVLEYIVPYDLGLSEISLRPVDGYFYTGMEIKPELELWYLDKRLDLGLFNIEYQNNIRPGEAEIIITPKDNHYQGEVRRKFIIEKAINSCYIEYQNGEIVIDNKYGEAVLKYYKDIDCLEAIAKPTLPGNYYVRAEILEGDVYQATKSNVLEYKIPLPDPTIDLSSINAGNDGAQIRFNMSNLQKTAYWVEILKGGELIKKYDAIEGENNLIVDGLEMSSEYTVNICGDTPDGAKAYLTDKFITLDGSRPVFFYDVRSKLIDPTTTTIEYYIKISDPLNIYSSYSLEIYSNDMNVGHDSTSTKEFSLKLADWCPPGLVAIEVSGYDDVNAQTTQLDRYEFNHISLAERPKEFPVKYEVPTKDEITYRYNQGQIELNIPFDFLDLVEMAFIRVNILDDKGRASEDDIYGNGDIIYLPEDTGWIEIGYTEIYTVDDTDFEYNKGSIAGRINISEAVNALSIRADKKANRLNIDFDLNYKAGMSAKLTNDQNQAIEACTSTMSIELPQVLTTYTYQMYDSNDLAVGEAKSFTVDPAYYNIKGATSFTPLEPRDVLKSFNPNDSVNIYIYTGFKSDNPGLSQMVRATGAINEKSSLHYSKTEVIEICDLKEDVRLEYFIGEMRDGVYYLTDSYTTSLDTRTDNSDYRGFTSKSFDGTNTTISFAFKDNDRIYDFDNSIVYPGTYEGHTINNSDFTYDANTGTYSYSEVVPGEITWFDYSFKANKNIKNLDKIQGLTTIKGSLYGRVSLYDYAV